MTVSNPSGATMKSGNCAGVCKRNKKYTAFEVVCVDFLCFHATSLYLSLGKYPYVAQKQVDILKT